MSSRDPKWLQRGLDAMRETLDVDAATKAAMIDFLMEEGFWDSRRLTPAAARTRFNACMNPMKTEFFKLSELWALMKHFHRYQLLDAMCQDMGFEPPRKLPTSNLRAELQQKLDALASQHADQVAELRAQIEQLDGAADAPRQDGNVRLHPAMREDGARFALNDDDTNVGDMSPGGF